MTEIPKETLLDSSIKIYNLFFAEKFEEAEKLIQKIRQDFADRKIKPQDLDGKDIAGSTALHLAALIIKICGNKKLFDLLISEGANPLIKNKNGQKPTDLFVPRIFLIAGNEIDVRYVADEDKKYGVFLFKILDPKKYDEQIEAIKIQIAKATQGNRILPIKFILNFHGRIDRNNKHLIFIAGKEMYFLQLFKDLGVEVCHVPTIFEVFCCYAGFGILQTDKKGKAKYEKKGKARYSDYDFNFNQSELEEVLPGNSFLL
ncbi:MAG: ankyrin repeat domain-containing protein [Pseudomonadota bacterium]